MSRSLLDWSEIDWIRVYCLNKQQVGVEENERKPRVWVRVGNFDLLIPVRKIGVTSCSAFIECIQNVVLTRNLPLPRLRHITVNGLPGALASAVFPGAVLMAEWPTGKGWRLPSGPVMVTAPMAMLSSKHEIKLWKTVKAYEEAAKALLSRPRNDTEHLFSWHDMSEKPLFRGLDFYMVNIISSSKGMHIMMPKDETFGTVIERIQTKMPETTNYTAVMEPCPSFVTDVTKAKLADHLLWTQCETLEMSIDHQARRLHFVRLSDGPLQSTNEINHRNRRGRKNSKNGGDRAWSLRSWSPTHRKEPNKTTLLAWEGIEDSQNPPSRQPSSIASPTMFPRDILPSLFCGSGVEDPAASGSNAPHIHDPNSDNLGILSRRNSPIGEYDLHPGKRHLKTVLKSTVGARQFEFHPTIQDLMLIGQKDGTAAIVNTDTDTMLTRKKIDQTPILALAWFRSHPQMAVSGAIHTGNLFFLRYEDGDGERERALKQVQLQPFGFWMGGAELSSLSVNCTDDYVAISGFSKDIALYDVHTGSCVNVVKNVHNDWVNIVRFANQSPHILASASFDQSLKLFDLRCGLDGDRPVKAYHNNSMNVMCNFSPDDRNILLSGVDSNVVRLNVPDLQQMGNIDIPAAGSRTNYRRSVFLSKDMFVTAATDESFARVVHVDGTEYGCVDFAGSLKQESMGSIQRIPLVSSVLRQLNRRVPFRQNARQWANQSPTNAEYVQSLRGHPDDASLMGALVVQSSQQMKSCVSLVKLDGVERKLQPAHSVGWGDSHEADNLGWVGP